ncbi:hypothetical protein V8C86DRAFT_3033508 [Haematococcus lacustris]
MTTTTSLPSPAARRQLAQGVSRRYWRAIDLAHINMASQRRIWLKPYLEVTVQPNQRRGEPPCRDASCWGSPSGQLKCLSAKGSCRGGRHSGTGKGVFRAKVSKVPEQLLVAFSVTQQISRKS